MGLKDLLLQGPTANNQTLEGNQGPQFEDYVNSAYAVGNEPTPNVIGDTVAERGLTQDYNYTHGNSSATAVASQLDLNGAKGPQFSNYSNSAFGVAGEPGPPNSVDTIAEQSLTQPYNYTHGNSSATANASLLDLNGQVPSQYLNNLPT
jgi:hypothetical protein